MTHSPGYDPYRYGPPPERRPSGNPTGRQILGACWALLRQDKSMLLLPLISMGAAIAAAGALFVPGWFAGVAIGGSHTAGGYAGGVLALFGLSIVSIFFQAALVIGANQRADGYAPTLGGVIAAAWSIRGLILSWAIVTTTVGLVIRAIEERLGIFGKIVGIVAGLAWAIASFLVVPVIVAERVGPFAAVKRSGSIIKQRWGTGLRTTLRWGLIQFVVLVPVFAALVFGIALVFTGGAAAAVVGAVLLATAVVALLGLIVVSSAVSTYAQTMIYRFAMGRPIPIPVELMDGAFVAKRRRGRRE